MKGHTIRWYALAWDHAGRVERLPRQQLDRRAAGREPDDAELLGPTRHDLEGLRPDRARAAQDHHVAHAAEPVALAVEDGAPGQPGHEDARRAHIGQG